MAVDALLQHRKILAYFGEAYRVGLVVVQLSKGLYLRYADAEVLMSGERRGVRGVR